MKKKDQTKDDYWRFVSSAFVGPVCHENRIRLSTFQVHKR